MLVDLQTVIYALEVCQCKAQFLGFDTSEVGDGENIGGLIQRALDEVAKFEADEVDVSHSSEDFIQEPDEPESFVADEGPLWHPDDSDWEPGEYDTGGEG